MDIIEYRSGLATWELIAEVHQLLATGRRTEQLICRYLADLADRVQQRRDLALAHYVDELHAARSCFGLGAREARERIRVGRALRQLPAIERAFVEGELSYSRVREVTRIAVAETESEWLGLACRLDMRTLERRVAAARTQLQDYLDDEAPSFETRPKTRRVTFDLSEQAYELLQAALESARSANGGGSDAEALERLAHEALLARTPAAESATAGNDAATDKSATAGDDAATDKSATAGDDAATDIAQRDDTGPSRAAKSIKPWSWDELGWDPTQRGSSHNDESRDSKAAGGRATQRGSWRGDDESGSTSAADIERRNIERLNIERRDDVERCEVERCEVERCEVERCEVECREVERGQASERERLSEINSRLLRAMGGRGRWVADTLIEVSGLSASEVNSALTLLQLSGRIRRRADAFEPV